ncbi:LysR substrate-binding domain-containing protein [Pseudoxanthomonas sp. JBR18]|uniref:LysR substrate-binding domain-containing protein n=1 Tax=Pseudoxanthomonas sp. JBR18 TaxID=2969308 RepID=UPI0023064A67|nr:LysR substrate-binding domain-containing protein [Pseudoxanthomonas sp. JBR18]WCE05344.1 LysR substrate-binding domain-containing protein [Pseudoxanthomonas sp. JBR18]
MKQKKLLPSMVSLQCFESAARHMSFTNAAQELNLTQSAVSKQVAQLEQALQRRLFERVRNGLALTPAGELYHAEVSQVLSQTDIASRAVLSFGGETEVLRIATQPTFGARWLIPALAGFGDQHPHLRLSIRNALEPFDLVRATADIAFFYGAGSWPGAVCEALFRETVVAVCTPLFLQTHPVSAAEDLTRSTLLQCTSRPEAWYDWFGGQGITSTNSYHGPQFDTFDLCIRAALAGYGVALVPRFMVADELRQGTLVIPWAHARPGSGAYYLAHAEHTGELPKVRAFVEWIRTRAAGEREPAAD